MPTQRKIKILQVAQEPITIWSFLRELIFELQKRGYEVETACNSHNAALLSDLQNEGIKNNIIDIKRTLNPVNAVKTFFQFIRLFKSKKYDIVVAHTPIVSFIVRFAAYFSKIPVIIYTAHGLPFTSNMNVFKYAFFLMLEKLAGLVTTGLICINEEDSKAAVKYKLVPGGTIREIHGIGVDTDKFKRLDNKFGHGLELKSFLEKDGLDNRLSISEDSKVVLFSGRLIESKGIREYLQMAKSFLAVRSDLIFLISGYGPLDNYVRSYIKENNLDKHVLYLGFRKDMPDIIKLADIFVLPTYYPEGLPRTILEAMAVGIPVVTTNIRGCRQLIEDGVNGYLVPPKNPDELERDVASVLLTPDYSLKMGMLSREKIKKDYQLCNVICEQIDIYEELLQKNYKLV